MNLLRATLAGAWWPRLAAISVYPLVKLKAGRRPGGDHLGRCGLPTTPLSSRMAPLLLALVLGDRLKIRWR